ncbi:MAG: hypothetical protein AMJ84_01380 [Acidithiobacillales bacterium SM23_46]|jgi:hypothetical protein|nr:MAG: hypothetical protein AMS22_06460 [Thiotrichales bacterium SG8_50]KPK73936.1 MAG: hypothetical protein AMJ84_01380 [Acidithiobacillales bacterium SM23_46]KPL27857.1 MAG: hypothetical protein AMJ72_06405 [Acidithiobacillales bacterium SM1_46]
MNAPTRLRWLTLVISLSGRRGTARMRVWRALKARGAAVLRDGVYLLPESSGARELFEAQAGTIRGAGGNAHVLVLDHLPPSESTAFRAMFDRTGEYGRIIEGLRKFRGTAVLRRRGSADALRKLRREFEAVRATDYFPGAAAEEAQAMLLEIEALLRATQSPGEPITQTGTVPRLDARGYRGRLWATRARPWVDRLASAWLIRRFVDPKARILWLKDIRRCPRNALGFDFDGARFSHVGTRVTFEVLAASFGLEEDRALMRVAALVHCLDVGGAPVAEAAGIAAVLTGLREQYRKDDALLTAASAVFDSLYIGYQQRE